MEPRIWIYHNHNNVVAKVEAVTVSQADQMVGNNVALKNLLTCEAWCSQSIWLSLLEKSKNIEVGK